jgi:hypothetical protein
MRPLPTVLVTIAASVTVSSMAHAEASLASETANDAATISSFMLGRTQTSRHTPINLRPGERVRIRTGSVVDLPGVVRMRTVDGAAEISRRGQIVTQSSRTLTVSSKEGAAPVTVAKPHARLEGFVLGVESGVVRLDLETADHVVVMLPVAAIAELSLLPMKNYAGAPTPAGDLVGESVLVGVGHSVEMPPTAGPPGSPESRTIIIDGGRFREVPASSQTTMLLPPADSALAGRVESVDEHVLTVRLHGRPQVVTVPRSAISSLAVVREQSQAGKGALVGAGVGLALGLGAVVYNHGAARCTDGGDDPGLCTAIDVGATVSLVVSGALIGAVAGALTHEYRRERVDAERLRISVAPGRHGGVRAGLSMRF